MTDLSDTPLPTLPSRGANSHKGDYGRALVVGGSRGMAGAPALAGMACLRSGAGLVGVATPGCVQPTVAAFCPAYTTHALPDDDQGLRRDAAAAIHRLLEPADAAAIGPGLGRSAAITSVIDPVMASPTPLVIDADGLNALAELLGACPTPAGPRVLTPHAGEFARLDGGPLSDPNDNAERVARASALAEKLGGPETVVLLKGPRTVVTDGDRFAVNTTGNPGMATGGSGDVLTGVITALLAQGVDAFNAARLGAHAHGLAGDLAAAKLGRVGMIASDLVDCLPAAWEQLRGHYEG